MMGIGDGEKEREREDRRQIHKQEHTEKERKMNIGWHMKRQKRHMYTEKDT